MEVETKQKTEKESRIFQFNPIQINECCDQQKENFKVKLDREKSSGSLNVLSFLLGAGIKPNPPSNKSAILFCLGKVFPRLVI